MEPGKEGEGCIKAAAEVTEALAEKKCICRYKGGLGVRRAILRRLTL